MTLSGLSLHPHNEYSDHLHHFPELLTPRFDSSINKHGVEHHIETYGPPVHARARRLNPEKLTAAKAEFENGRDGQYPPVQLPLVFTSAFSSKSSENGRDGHYPPVQLPMVFTPPCSSKSSENGRDGHYLPVQLPLVFTPPCSSKSREYGRDGHYPPVQLPLVFTPPCSSKSRRPMAVLW